MFIRPSFGVDSTTLQPSKVEKDKVEEIVLSNM